MHRTELTNQADAIMHTMTVPIDEVADANGGLDDFRLSSRAEISGLLKQLREANVTLNLNAPDGRMINVTLWDIDATRDALTFSTDASTSQLEMLTECDEAVVVGYLDRIKLQFDVSDLMMVHANNGRALNCAFPHEIFRFQRRSGYRVRPMVRSSPTARLRHPMIPEMQLSLRILDVSITGCAIFLPDNVPPMAPGVVINNVQIDLDADTRILTSLRMQHVSSISADSKGVRLGCELLNPAREGLRALQLYIDQTQKRRRLMALD
jgi:flagellar brake protein